MMVRLAAQPTDGLGVVAYTMPPQIEAALTLLSHCTQIRMAPVYSAQCRSAEAYDPSPPEMQRLSPPEEAAYNAALAAIKSFVSQPSGT